MSDAAASLCSSGSLRHEPQSHPPGHHTENSTWWGMQRAEPRRRPTPTRMVSLSICRHRADRGGAVTQAPASFCWDSSRRTLAMGVAPDMRLAAVTQVAEVWPTPSGSLLLSGGWDGARNRLPDPQCLLLMRAGGRQGCGRKQSPNYV